MPVFALFIFAVYGICCFYIGTRLQEWLRLLLPAMQSPLFWAIWVVVAMGSIMTLFLRRGVLARPAAYIGGVWIAVFFYSLMLCLVLDVVRLLSRIGGGSRVFRYPTPWRGGLAAILIIALIAGGMIHAGNIRIKRYTVDIAGLPATADGLTIAMLSDIHLGVRNGAPQIEKIVAAINAQQPDIVCLVGDIFDGSAEVRDIDKIEMLLRGIESRYGVYVTFGNHDVDDPTGEMARILERAGVTLLFDEIATLDCGLMLAGRRDQSPISREGAGGTRLSLAELVGAGDGTLIVLDHQPSRAAVAQAQAQGAALMLSGHTHRGQIFPFGILVRLVYPQSYGLYEVGNTAVVVSSGVGTWGPPMRVGTNSEVVLITLRQA